MMYFRVVAKCGHVGKGKYIEVSYPIYAENGREAAKIVMNYTKVKKHLKNAISGVYEITYEEYEKIRLKNKCDKYLRAHCSQEINLLDLDIKDLDKKNYKSQNEFESRKDRIAYILKKERIIRRELRYEFVY